MAKLTDAQLVLLSKASQREDRAVELSRPLTGGAVKTIESLLDRGLLTETSAEPAMPVYRRAKTSNEPVALVITELGLVAIGITSEIGQEEKPSKPKRAAKSKQAAKALSPRAAPAAAAAAATGKTALVLKLLQRKGGASITAMTEVTGWLPHSTRAVLTGLRKKGFVVERGKDADHTTIYKIARGKAA